MRSIHVCGECCTLTLNDLLVVVLVLYTYLAKSLEIIRKKETWFNRSGDFIDLHVNVTHTTASTK